MIQIEEKKSSLRADLERAIIYLSTNSGEDRAHIAMVSKLVPPNVAATIDEHISNSDPISFWRERQRDPLKESWSTMNNWTR